MVVRTLAVMVVVLACLMGCSAHRPSAESSAQPRPSWAGMEAPAGYRLPDMALKDTRGHSFNLRSTTTAPIVVVTFGYCDSPGLTPTSLKRLADALAELDAGQRAKVEVVFISIDDDDSGPELRECLGHYDSDWIGLHGSGSKVKEVARAMGVDIRKNESDSREKYAYSPQIVGFGPDRSARVVWLPDHDAIAIAADLTVLTGQP